MILSLLTLVSILWFVWMIRSLRRLPVLVTPECIVMRVGRLRTIAVPITHLAALRTSFTGEEIKQRSTANLALIAWPNILLELDPPLSTRRGQVRAVAHRLDDPVGFVRAVEPLLQRHSGR